MLGIRDGGGRKEMGMVIKCQLKDSLSGRSISILPVMIATWTYAVDKIVQNLIHTHHGCVRVHWGNLSETGVLYRCQRPGCDITLRFFRTLPYEESEQTYIGTHYITS